MEVKFTHQEQKTLIEILKNYSKIVDGKLTHSSTLKVHNLAWQKIAQEFNASPQAIIHRTPKQLRRLWMNLKHRQKPIIIKNNKLSAVHTVNNVAGSTILKIAHALMTGVDSSIDSDIAVGTEGNINEERGQSEASLSSMFLNEESQNVSNTETPVLSAVKIEAISPIQKYPTETREPLQTQNESFVPNNKDQNVNYESSFERDFTPKWKREMELHGLEVQLLNAKVRESQRKEVHAAELYNIEYQILKEKHREAKAKADLAELMLRRQRYSND